MEAVVRLRRTLRASIGAGARGAAMSCTMKNASSAAHGAITSSVAPISTDAVSMQLPGIRGDRRGLIRLPQAAGARDFDADP